MINVTINDKNFLVEGHDNNEICSRVSTLSQLALKILPISTDSKREDGYTFVELNDKATKKDVEIFNLFCETLYELQVLYFRQLTIKNNSHIQFISENKNEIKEKSDEVKTKEKISLNKEGE